MKKGLEIEINIDDFIQIEKFKAQFESKTKEELVEFYFTKQNDEQPMDVKIYRLFALKQLLKDRFGDKLINYNGKKLRL